MFVLNIITEWRCPNITRPRRYDFRLAYVQISSNLSGLSLAQPSPLPLTLPPCKPSPSIAAFSSSCRSLNGEGALTKIGADFKEPTSSACACCLFARLPGRRFGLFEHVVCPRCLSAEGIFSTPACRLGAWRGIVSAHTILSPFLLFTKSIFYPF